MGVEKVILTDEMIDELKQVRGLITAIVEDYEKKGNNEVPLSMWLLTQMVNDLNKKGGTENGK